MASIDDLKLWRSEPLVKDYINWNFERPYLGKWWSTDLPFVRDWGSAGNLMYELDLPYPLADKKTKSALDLIDDMKIIKNYTPVDAHGFAMGSENLELVDKKGYNQKWEWRKPEGPLRTHFEHAWTNPRVNERLNIVTPDGLDANRKINFWESIRKNLKPTYSFLDRKYRKLDRLRNLAGLPQKLWELYKLKQSGAPMVSGINWQPAANVGINTLRGVGLAGDALLGGMALSDVFVGTSTVGNMAKNINKWTGAPVYPAGHEKAGNVIHNIQAAKAMQGNYTAPDRGDWGPGLHLNRGGIASLMV
jgi:hypothetical protein